MDFETHTAFCALCETLSFAFSACLSSLSPHRLSGLENKRQEKGRKQKDIQGSIKTFYYLPTHPLSRRFRFACISSVLGLRAITARAFCVICGDFARAARFRHILPNLSARTRVFMPLRWFFCYALYPAAALLPTRAFSCHLLTHACAVGISAHAHSCAHRAPIYMRAPLSFERKVNAPAPPFIAVSPPTYLILRLFAAGSLPLPSPSFAAHGYMRGRRLRCMRAFRAGCAIARARGGRRWFRFCARRAQARNLTFAAPLTIRLLYLSLLPRIPPHACVFARRHRRASLCHALISLSS